MPGRIFYFQNNYSFEIRIAQVNAMLEDLQEIPILGTGFGASLKGITRNVESPWSYEITYAPFIVWTVLLGFFYIRLASFGFYGFQFELSDLGIN